MNCQFCKKECKATLALIMHERSCPKNQNRLPGSFSGKTHTIEAKKRQGKSIENKTPKNLYEVSLRTLQKILKRMNVICSNCGWDKTTCDIHHIIHKKRGGSNDHSNLTILCPNCHRLAHEKKLIEMISFEKQYGEKWREFYFSHE
jgi:5-methylcytosine-specific restriction endonuclease McrA